MKMEYTRKMDELGRVVLPRDMRDALAMHEGDVLAVSREDDRIILQKKGRSCWLCGSEDSIIELSNHSLVCAKCAKEIDLFVRE